MTGIPFNADLLSAPEAARHLRLSEPYLAKLRCWGGGPSFLKLGRRVVYRRSDLDAWLEGKLRVSTSSRSA